MRFLETKTFNWIQRAIDIEICDKYRRKFVHEEIVASVASSKTSFYRSIEAAHLDNVVKGLPDLFNVFISMHVTIDLFF